MTMKNRYPFSSAASTAAFLVVAACSAGERDMKISGMYVWGGEVESISPCESAKDYWVSGQDSVLNVARARAELLAKERGTPFQPVYVEMTGRLVGRADDGFASDYDDVFEVDHVGLLDQEAAEGCKQAGAAG